MVAGDEITKDGIREAEFDMYAGDPDKKWKVVDAGIYSLCFDLRNWTMSASYVREQDAPVVEPIEADALYMVGSSTPNEWNIDNPTELERKSDYVFVYEGPLAEGEMKACTTTGSWAQLPVARHSFISPALRGPSHTKTSGSSFVGVIGVGASMLHPFGVASPTRYNVGVFMGRLPSMIMWSFSPSHPAAPEVRSNSKNILNMFFIFMICNL